MLKKMRILVLSCVSIVLFGMLAMAQMMGGSRGGAIGSADRGGIGANGSMNGTVGSMAGSMMPASAGMSSGGGMDGAMGMADGAVTVGSDGTLYILSRVFIEPSQAGSLVGTIKTRLSAVNGTNGNTLWNIVFDENWLTKPVQAPDGRLFLVAFGGMGMQVGMFNTAGDPNQDSILYIVNPASGQVIGQPVTLGGEVASVPTIVGSASNYVVYVVTFDMGYNSNSRSGVQGPRRESTLYAFNQNGTLLFSRPLNQ
jgi:outer membrane protein assembly factor BamB